MQGSKRQPLHPSRSWLEVDDGRHLLVKSPDNYRPDLQSPVPNSRPTNSRSPVPNPRPTSSRSPVPSPRRSKALGRQSVDSETSKPTIMPVFSEESKTRMSESIQAYSTDFESETKTDERNTGMYSDDFETWSASRSGIMRKSSEIYSGQLDVIKTESITEQSEIHTMVDVTADDGMTSGRTSKLTWQYSEDFEDTDRGPLDESLASLTGAGTDSSYSQSTRKEVSVLSEAEGSTDDDRIDDIRSVTDNQLWSDTESSQVSEYSDDAALTAQDTFIEKALKRARYPVTDQHDQREAVQVRGIGQPAQPSRTETLIAAHGMSSGITPHHKTASHKDTQAMKTFCRRLTEKIQQQTVTGPPQTSTSQIDLHPDHADSLKIRKLGMTPGDHVENHGVSPFAINRLRLENTKAKLERMAKEHVHDPHECPHCLSSLEEVTRRAFIKQVLHLAEERRIQEKLDKHINTDLSTQLLKEPVVLPGELQQQYGDLAPWMICGHLQEMAQQKSGDLSITSGDQSHDHILCPSLMASENVHRNQCPKLSDNRLSAPRDSAAPSDNLTQHLQLTKLEVDNVKAELSAEAERLSNLDPQQFWREYFSKLSQSTNQSFMS